MLSCVLIVLTEGEGPVTSSYSVYIDSVCVLLPDVLVNCSSLIFALLLFKMIPIVVAKTTTLVIKATARELVAIKHDVSLSSDIVFTLIGALT